MIMRNRSSVFMQGPVMVSGQSAMAAKAHVSSGYSSQDAHAGFLARPRIADTVTRPVNGWNIGDTSKLDVKDVHNFMYRNVLLKFHPQFFTINLRKT